MPREYASPELANLIAARLHTDEIEQRLRVPLTPAEAQDIADLIDWFSRRYPTAKDRLTYARRKLQQLQKSQAERSAAIEATDGTEAKTYLAAARRLAAAHRENDPKTLLVFLASDPHRKKIRLLEVTRSAPTIGDPLAVEFLPRPDLGYPFACTLVLLSPDEWEAVKEDRLDLPVGFRKEALEPL
jgi:hypothetical protein